MEDFENHDDLGKCSSRQHCTMSDALQIIVSDYMIGVNDDERAFSTQHIKNCNEFLMPKKVNLDFVLIIIS